MGENRYIPNENMIYNETVYYIVSNENMICLYIKIFNNIQVFIRKIVEYNSRGFYPTLHAISYIYLLIKPIYYMVIFIKTILYSIEN